MEPINKTVNESTEIIRDFQDKSNVSSTDKFPASDSACLVASSIRTEFSSGPLPHPSLLKEYDSIIKDGAERIMQMAEKEQAARLERLSDEVKFEQKSQKIGQYMAFIIALIIFGMFITMIYTGQTTGAYMLLGVGGLSVIGLVVKAISIAHRKDN